MCSSRNVLTCSCSACDRSLCWKSTSYSSVCGQVGDGRDGSAEQEGHGGPEVREALADRLALQESVVDAFGDHGKLEVAEPHVPVQVIEVAIRSSAIALDHLRRCRPAFLGTHPRHDEVVLRRE